MLEKLLAQNIVVQERITQLKTESNLSKYELNTKSELNSKNELNITNNLEINNISKYSNIMPKLTEQNNNNKTDVVKEKLSVSQLTTNLKFRKVASSKTIRTNKTIDANAKTSSRIKEIFNFYSRQHNLIGA